LYLLYFPSLKAISAQGKRISGVNKFFFICVWISLRHSPANVPLHSAIIGRGYQDFKPSKEKIREIEREAEAEEAVSGDEKWARMSQKDFEAWRNRDEARRRERR
jgi:hypothetical protein